ncbi:MAG: hypothetical protein V4448_05000 [Pseudomonadota bacterium]
MKLLVNEGSRDQLALSTYFNIAVRSGFSDDAINLLEKLLSNENKRSRRFYLQTMLFGLVNGTDPTSTRAVEIAWQLGVNADQTVEKEEGTFIVALLRQF